MPIGKPRLSKRSSSSSSSSSYVSTISMVVFIGLCVFGVWMLTSTSVVPPQQTVRSSSSFSSNSNTRVSSKFPSRKDPPPAFDDSQGDLPDDAIKGDLEDKSKEAENVNLEVGGGGGGGSVGSSNEDDGSSSAAVIEDKQEESNQQEATSVTKEDENVNLDQTQHEQQVSENENPNQSDSEAENNENPSLNQNNQHDPEVEPHEITQQIQQETGENPKPISTSEEETSSNETHEEKQEQPEIREVTSEETQTQQESQESEQTQNSQTSAEAEEDRQQQQNQEVASESNTNDENQQQEQENGSQETQQQASEDQQQQQTEENNTQGETQESAKNENQETQNSGANSGSGGVETFPGGDQSGIPKESAESKNAWSTQAAQSVNQKERRKEEGGASSNGGGKDASMYGYTWELCNVTAGQDYIPCLDNEKAVKMLHYTGHFEHRERHCPEPGPTCLVPLPEGYKQSVEWPMSRDKIWYHNVPHTKLAEVKGHQNWVKVTGEFLTFPGGGTQFIHGALHYIDFIQKAVPHIAWGKHTRVILDVGCGVASFGGYLFERDVLAMSFAPKDEHEAQVQFALERGIPAISAVMGSQRLPFPSRVFDLVHCARCRVPWHVEGGRLLLELNRVLRPGGFFVWSATPVYQKLAEDVEIWKAMSTLTVSMCWELVTIQKDKLNSVGAAIYRKPLTNDCYEQRKQNSPPMCKTDDDPNAAWYVPLQSCIHRVPVDEKERGTQWPEEWPARVHKPPYWLDSSQKGVYGKSAPDDFTSDYEHWKRVVTKSYMTGLGISWSNVRNVMDMRAVYGGFAAALKDLKVWVMNVVSIDAPDTLPIIYERGLFGIYHDWCESFSTYPRTYDLLHADQLFSKLKKRCNILPVIAEVDRIVRPGGKLIVRDESSVVSEIENMLKSLHWEIHLTFSKDKEAILSAQKTDWRPDSYSASS